MAPSQSALGELRERLDLNGVQADPLRVATAILGLAQLHGWTEHPERMGEWIERLALEAVNSPT
jgi:hypothetical protein